MSALTLQEIILTIIEIIVLFFLIVYSMRLTTGGKKRLLPVLFAFAMISYLLSDLYYLIYDFIRPDTRMPFAANEIAECALLLLLSAELEVLPEKKGKIIYKALVFSVLFICANIALWIVWSGEWVQDIVFGIPYIYFMYRIIAGMIKTNAFSMREWIISILISILLVVMQVLLIQADGFIYKLLDYGSYALMFSYVIWLMAKTFILIKLTDDRKDIYISHMFFLTTILVMYASSNIFYNIAVIFNMISAPTILLSIKKEYLRDDLC